MGRGWVKINNMTTIRYKIFISQVSKFNALFFFASSTLSLRFNPFYYPFKSQLLGAKSVFKHQDLKMFGPKLDKYV